MLRLLVMVAMAVLMAGCAQPPAWSWLDTAGRHATETTPRQFRFDWQIDGDPGLAPLQVFDDGNRTWLQYPTDQAVPAIFQRTARGDRLQTPVRQGDYLVLDGVPAHLVMRGGHLTAEVRLLTNPGLPSRGPVREQASIHDHAPVRESAPVRDHAPVRESAPMPPVAEASPAIPIPLAAPVPLPGRAPAPAVLPPPVSVVFQVSPADENIRKALGRWARDAGWVFKAEHWAVDVDIPLAGSAVLGDEFRPAVRALLAATELGERPLQPCFYANRVLRVIPLAQRCDRTATATATAGSPS